MSEVLPLGIKIGKKHNELIEEKSKLPIKKNVKFFTSFSGQTNIEFCILQWKAKTKSWFILDGIPSKSGEEIEVTFEISKKGDLRVFTGSKNILKAVALSIKKIVGGSTKATKIADMCDYYNELNRNEEYYKILSIKEDASQDNIEEASKYKKRIYPKDSGERAIEEIRGIVNSASTALSTLENRAKYHVQRVFKKLKVKGRDYWRIEDIFKEFKDKERNLETVIKKGDSYIEKRVKEILNPKDQPLTGGLEITEGEAKQGGAKTLSIKNLRGDEEKITIHLSRSTKTGDKIRVPDKGGESEVIPGLIGDLVIEIKVSPAWMYWYNKGKFLETMGKHIDALRCYDKAVEINPNFAEAWFSKGVFYVAYIATIFDFSKIRRSGKLSSGEYPQYSIEPDGWIREVIVGYVAADLSRLIDVGYITPTPDIVDIKYPIVCFDKAIEINPKYADAWDMKGDYLYKIGRYQEAVNCCDKILEINPKYAGAWINKGNALSDLGRYEEAIRCYDKALEINPKFTEAWINKGDSLKNLKRYKEAIQAFQKFIELNPSEDDPSVKRAEKLILDLQK